MRLIYIEATKEEIAQDKTLAEALGDALKGFCSSIVRFEPVIKAKYEFNEEENNDEDN